MIFLLLVGWSWFNVRTAAYALFRAVVVVALIFCLAGLTAKMILAGTITGVSYGENNSVVGTYVAASQSDFVIFSPATALAAASTVEVTYPVETVLTSANLAASDFRLSQETQGLCTSAGTDTAPTAIVVNEGNRTITFTVALASISKTVVLAPCGLGQMSIKTSSSLSGNEIRNPTTTTTTGTLSIVIGAAVDSGSISNVTFVADAATQLAFTTQPSGSVVAGQNLGSQPVVTIRDQYGNTVTSSSASVTLAAVLASDTNTLGGGTLNATTNPLSASSGVATYGGVNYTKAEQIKLRATSSGLTTVFSNSISVSPAAAFKLVVSQQPSASVIAGQNLAIQPVFLVQDQFNNTLSSDNSTQVTLAAVLSSDGTTAGGGTLSATSNPVTVSSGVATLAGVNYTKAESIKLRASSGSLVSALTNTIVIQAGAVDSLVKVSGDAQAVAVNGGESSTIVVRAVDSFLNSVSGATVNFVISSVPHGAVGQSLSAASVVTDSGGLASSTLIAGNLLGIYEVTVSGSGSVLFTLRAINPAVPEKLPSNKLAEPWCGEIVGEKAPIIYGSSLLGSEAVWLYFTPASEPFDHYALKYGVESGKYIYGADNIPKKEKAFLVRYLAPNTNYYFRIRAGNVCATGEWSREYKVRTIGLPRKPLKQVVKPERIIRSDQVIPTPTVNIQKSRVNGATTTAKKTNFIWKLWQRFARKP